MEPELDFDQVIGRAKTAFGVKTDAELCELIGFSTSRFANRKRTGSIPYAELIAVAAERKVSLDVVFFHDPPLQVKSRDGVKSTPGAEEDLVPIPHYDAIGSCGHGSWIESARVIEIVPVARSWLLREGLVPEQTVIIGSRGNSMYPVIKSGERLMLDRSKTDPSLGGIFAFVYQGEMSIKYLQRLNGGLQISSEDSVSW